MIIVEKESFMSYIPIQKTLSKKELYTLILKIRSQIVKKIHNLIKNYFSNICSKRIKFLKYSSLRKSWNYQKNGGISRKIIVLPSLSSVFEFICVDIMYVTVFGKNV